MSLHNTPMSERITIGLFGKMNAGKSSIINAITNQQVSIVSNIKGTTTDPVYKSMELLPLGPVTLIDTSGLDDNTDLGRLRIDKTLDIIRKIDIALLIVDVNIGITEFEKNLIKEFEDKKKEYIIVYNKCDLSKTENKESVKEIYVSANQNININRLKEKIGECLKVKKEKNLVSDLVDKGDVVVLVTPIDNSAPKGRLILPQQQVIRELLDKGAIPVVTRETELELVLSSLKEQPKLVITDSQVFKQVDKIVPKKVSLTSFSILFARYKGELETLVKGVKLIDELQENDIILISEGCTHHRQCGDIGSVKIPKWIEERTRKKIRFDTSSGNEFPKDLNKYKLIIHCGGCMLNSNEMKYRIDYSTKHKKYIINYGIAISFLHGTLERSLELFKNELEKNNLQD